VCGEVRAISQTDSLTVVNTASRALRGDEAAKRIREAVGEIPRSSFLMKKIDSTLRGPVHGELVIPHAHPGPFCANGPN